MTNCVPGGTMTAPGGGPRPPYMDGCTTTPIGTPFGRERDLLAHTFPGGSRMGGAMGKGHKPVEAAPSARAAGFFPRSRALRRLLRLPRGVAGGSQHGARRVARW